VSRHEHYPGDDASIPPEDKLADVLRLAEISEDKKLKNPVFSHFREDTIGTDGKVILHEFNEALDLKEKILPVNTYAASSI